MFTFEYFVSVNFQDYDWGLILMYEVYDKLNF
jgi:hypothetical protein